MIRENLLLSRVREHHYVRLLVESMAHFQLRLILSQFGRFKEYYYTTTFGSRVADGVYETLLDGMELEELREHEQIKIQHYLITDARYTWWECGKAYLCRMFDMLHMGYTDEILFGREVVEEMPRIVAEWVSAYKNRQ